MGSWATSVWRMDEAKTDCVVSTRGLAPVTVRFSWMPATDIWKSIVRAVPVRSSIALRVCGENPDSSARTEYVAAKSAGTVYSPSELVTVSRATPVAVLVTVIVTPGRTAPPWSTTRPLMVAVAWAKADPLVDTSNTAQSTTLAIETSSLRYRRRPKGRREFRDADGISCKCDGYEGPNPPSRRSVLL